MLIARFLNRRTVRIPVLQGGEYVKTLDITTCGADAINKKSVYFLLEVLASIPLEPEYYQVPEDCFREMENGSTFFHGNFPLSFPFVLSTDIPVLVDQLKAAICANLNSKKFALAKLYYPVCRKTPSFRAGI